MRTFNVLNGTHNEVYHLSIEQNTHLMVLEWEVEGEEFPRYIRMTGQQAEKLKDILFGGNFVSHTIPLNRYTLNRDIVTMKCYEEGQEIQMPINGIAKITDYYNKHKQMIARMDGMFRSRK